MRRLTIMLVLAIAAGTAGSATAGAVREPPTTQKAAQPVKPKPPKGFTALFNGKDLTGWRGRQPNYDPAAEAKLTKEELATKQAAWNTERDAHWTVDTDTGEIVSDGKNPHLATVKDYGDFEFHVDWLMVSAERRLRHLPARHPAGADLGPEQSARGAKRRARRDPARCGTTSRTTRASFRSSRRTIPSASGTP